MTVIDPFARRHRQADQYDIPPEVIAALRADIINDLRSDIRKPPIVNVAPPRVNVTTPAVSISPQISVQPGEAPLVNIDLPGLTEMAQGLAAVHNDLQELITLLHRPVTKTVDRNGNGTIESIRETR